MISVNEKLVDASYAIVYENPLFTLVSEKTRISVIKSLMKSFEINLNTFKFSTDLPSNNYISFTKFYGDTFVDVKIGIEELSVVFNRLHDGNLAYTIVNNVFNSVKGIKDFDIKSQKVVFWKHYKAENDIEQFFEDLNPNTPIGLEDLVLTKGAYYNLRDEKTNCNASILINKSFAFENGIFIHTDFQIHPNTLSFKQMFVYAGDLFNKIISTFSIDIKE